MSIELKQTNFQEDEEEKKQEGRERKTESKWMSCLLESLVIIVMVGLIPVSFILTEVVFNFGTRYLSEDCLERLFRNNLLVYNCNFTEEEDRV